MNRIAILLIALIAFSSQLTLAGMASAQQNQANPIPEDTMMTQDDAIKIRKHGSESVSIGQSRIIGEDEIIEDNAVVVGGNLTVYGQVNGDAVCIGGNLKVGPRAVIKGKLVNVGGVLEVDPSAKTYQDRVNIGGGPFGFFKDLQGVDSQKLGGAISMVMNCAYLLLLMFFALLLTTFMPRQFKNIEQKLNHEFPRCLLMGIASMIGFPIIILGFVITIVGILAVPFLLLALTLGSLAGYIVFSRVLGGRLLPEKALMLQILAGLLLLHAPALAGDLFLLADGAILSAIGHVFRVVGIILIISVSFIGMGAVVCLLLDRRKTMMSQAEKSNGSLGLPGSANSAPA